MIRSLLLGVGLPLVALLFAMTAFASDPRGPLVLRSSSGECVTSTDICGDGIDHTCSGSTRPCPGGDADMDGFADNIDCDPHDKFIYPGIFSACTAACGQGTRRCNEDGTFSSCSCTPLCEATGTGKCYYISALTGSDSNVGSFQSPWKSYAPITSYDSDSKKPAHWTALRPGDVVYFMSGLYTTTSSYYGAARGLILYGVSGSSSAPITLKAYPGASVVFAPATSAPAIVLDVSNYYLIEGFTVTGATDWGIRLGGDKGYEVRNCIINNTDAAAGANVAGISTISDQVNIHNNIIYDNYMRAVPANQNSRNIVMFDGGSVHIHHNTIFQSAPIGASQSAGCLTYKHAAVVAGSVFEVDHNIFWNCALEGVGSGTFGTRFHNNLLINSSGFSFYDFGGPTYSKDEVVEKNTIVGGPGLIYNPTNATSPIGLMTFRNNIVVDNRSSYSTENGIVRIHPYGGNDIFDATVTAGNLLFDGNCYFNSQTSPMFNLFGWNDNSTSSEGGFYTWSGWQSLGFDTHGVEADPQLNADFVPKNSACSNAGWMAP